MIEVTEPFKLRRRQYQKLFKIAEEGVFNWTEQRLHNNVVKLYGKTQDYAWSVYGIAICMGFRNFQREINYFIAGSEKNMERRFPYWYFSVKRISCLKRMN